MNQPYAFTFSTLRRVGYTMAAAVLVLVLIPALFNPGQANALQLQDRSIQMSDSSASGGNIASGVGSGTNVTYEVSFQTSATAATGSMVIDFCSQSPIVGNACAAPTGLNTSGATLNATAASGTVQTTTDNWAVTANTSQIKLADDNTGGAHPTHDMQVSTTETFSLSGITNPSAANCSPSDANCTFYARIYTYSGNTWGTYTNATNIGNYVDYGGVALSTTNPITITATVEEQLTFCVTSTDPTSTDTGWTTPSPSSTSDGCTATDLAYPSLILGHGTPNPVLDSTQTNTGNIFTDLSTNATSGVVIYMHSDNSACSSSGGSLPGGLSADNDATCAIPPVNGGSPGPVAINPGTAAFGMSCANYPVTGAGTIGSVPCIGDYNDGVHYPDNLTSAPVYYSMDTASNSVVGPYGSEIASSASPTYNAFNIYQFAATAALTTPAGIYQSALSLIATGDF